MTGPGGGMDSSDMDSSYTQRHSKAEPEVRAGYIRVDMSVPQAPGMSVPDDICLIYRIRNGNLEVLDFNNPKRAVVVETDEGLVKAVNEYMMAQAAVKYEQQRLENARVVIKSKTQRRV